MTETLRGPEWRGMAADRNTVGNRDRSVVQDFGHIGDVTLDCPNRYGYAQDNPAKRGAL